MIKLWYKKLLSVTQQIRQRMRWFRIMIWTNCWSTIKQKLRKKSNWLLERINEKFKSYKQIHLTFCMTNVWYRSTIRLLKIQKVTHSIKPIFSKISRNISTSSDALEQISQHNSNPKDRFLAVVHQTTKLPEIQMRNNCLSFQSYCLSVSLLRR